MSAQTIAEAAVERAREGAHARIRPTGFRTVQIAVETASRAGRLLRITAAHGDPLLAENPTNASGRSVVLPREAAVTAAAAWIDGTDLPQTEPETVPEAVADLHERVWQAALEACAPQAAADGWPAASDTSRDIVLAGPEGAGLTVTARLDQAGRLTGAAWQGRRANGAACHGHGRPEAAIAATTAWAASLDEQPIITPIGLRARREATGACQADLARLLGASQAVISQWENGSRAPRDPAEVAEAITALEALADALCAQALHDGTTTGVLRTWATDTDYWAADPAAAAQHIPAAVHRMATACAARTLAQRGIPARIIPTTPIQPGNEALRTT